MPEAIPQPDDLSFEDAMESLDAIVASLEGERLPLEEMVASYERGMKLLRVKFAGVVSAAAGWISIIRSWFANTVSTIA